MRQGDTFVKGAPQGAPQGPAKSPYARPNSASETFVPGMQESAPGVAENSGTKPKDNTPVIGFLYSISRKGIGEYWPLHLGTNTIGRTSDNDIVLLERSISEHHAVLSIKQMKSTGKLIASIRDVGSKNGMYLNDEELDYDNHTCKLNDIITVGSCYKLLLLLIDAADYGLSIAEDFVAEEEEEAPQEDFGAPQFAVGDATQSRFNPYEAKRVVDTGTVDLNGSQPTKPGGTKFM